MNTLYNLLYCQYQLQKQDNNSWSGTFSVQLQQTNLKVMDLRWIINIRTYLLEAKKQDEAQQLSSQQKAPLWLSFPLCDSLSLSLSVCRSLSLSLFTSSSIFLSPHQT